MLCRRALQMSDPKGSSHKPVFQCVVKVQKVGSEALERYVGEGSNKKVVPLLSPSLSSRSSLSSLSSISPRSS